MKKLLLLVLFITLLSGCTAQINLNITHDQIKEEGIFTFTYRETKYQDLLEYVNDRLVEVEYTSENLGYYKVEYDDLVLTASSTNSDNNYVLPFSLHLCYDNVTVKKEDNKLLIETSGNFKCFDKYNELSSIELNVKTNNKVLESNSDNIVNNNYTWKLNRGQSSKNIHILMQLEDLKKASIIKNVASWGILIVLILILIVSITLYMKYKSNKGNKI